MRLSTSSRSFRDTILKCVILVLVSQEWQLTHGANFYVQQQTDRTQSEEAIARTDVFSKEDVASRLQCVHLCALRSFQEVGYDEFGLKCFCYDGQLGSEDAKVVSKTFRKINL